MKPSELLPEFDRFLEGRGLRFAAAIVGGSAIALVLEQDRVTKDCDVLDPDIPPDVESAARDFAKEVRSGGEILRDDWLNNGPAQLRNILPADGARFSRRSSAAGHWSSTRSVAATS